MKMICPWTKVVIMLRNPVDRAFSQYQMCIDPSGTPEQLRVRGESSYRDRTFEEIVESEIRELQDCGVTPDCSYDHFRDSFLATRTMAHGGHSIVGRGLYALQVAEWMRQWPEAQLRVMSIAELRGGPEAVQRSLDGVFSFIGVPPIDVTDLEPKNTRSYGVLAPETRAKLEEFYRPFNEQLFTLLGRNLVW